MKRTLGKLHSKGQEQLFNDYSLETDGCQNFARKKSLAVNFHSSLVSEKENSLRKKNLK